MTAAGAGVSRRAFLRSAAGGAALVGVGGVPAWARPARHRHHRMRLRRPDSLPFPHLPAGTPTMHEIEHVVVLIMENHSFDNLLGMVPHRLPGRSAVDGLTVRRGRVADFNRDIYGLRVFASHALVALPGLPGTPFQAWNASHESYDGGLNDGFVRASGPVAMEFWDERDLPFTYSLARHFPLGERFFCSTLARRTRIAGSSSPARLGHDLRRGVGIPDTRRQRHDLGPPRRPRSGLGDLLPGPPELRDHPGLRHPGPDAPAAPVRPVRRRRRRRPPPAFTFLDPNYATTSEENPQDIQVGEQFVAGVVQALMRAPTWHKTALFITYDEHGGYYDHVPPPRAIKPDSIPPLTVPGDALGGFDRYGFRVPLIVVSPWARPAYTSRITQDLTSITAFVERKWNLPAMTFRDANAHPMTDYFDFSRRPAFAHPPRLAAAPGLAPGLAECHAAGLNPPLPAAV